MKQVEVTLHGPDGLDCAMTVMNSAFDARFGEAWTAAQCLGILSMPGAQLLVARNPDVAGFALLRIVADEAELMLLAVRPEFRRSGIGSALLKSSMQTASDAGAVHYFLEVRSDNPAIALYENCGLVNVGVRPHYYRGSDGVRRDALTYRKSLS
jgi:ribosomal-protein-alanine N-acetyltransferase